ncbi:uncharacterized protein PHACADRAFT_25022 [Phanerochaete carnosa HHB-10118-sp]|uniref:Uncharacterized protein n=1 Tax=Phanerochaete carnosa (strain HHB-10118-sp) TaxID=650164 RepID=K5WI17_PHACS|nr:uncharacterized protein PHACADRAFT_25022 [Phanerochaete carnosa HHB-10118-sp]EKM58759.1 hypothetical protein PHACADRAFT_25022 [Phanerochaete carnosa HHB-10118-sp]
MLQRSNAFAAEQQVEEAAKIKGALSTLRPLLQMEALSNLRRSTHLAQSFESHSESDLAEEEEEFVEVMGDLQLDGLEDSWRELELGEKDEDGLYLHQWLSETFECELIEFGTQLSSRDQAIFWAYVYKVKARLMCEAFAMLPTKSALVLFFSLVLILFSMTAAPNYAAAMSVLTETAKYVPTVANHVTMLLSTRAKPSPIFPSFLASLPWFATVTVP